MAKMFHVVAFPQPNPDAEHSRFHDLGSQLLQQSMSRAPKKTPVSRDSEFEYALVLSLPSIPEAVRDLLPPSQAKSLAEGGFPTRPAEYRRYHQVYFLNDAALKMYRGGGGVFEVLKKITEDELPQGCDMVMMWPH
jgi:hypothetical protein